MSDLNALLSKLDKVKPNGQKKWLSCCPAHPDKSPSLAIKLVDDRILMHCFAGCQVSEIVAAVGMTLSDLMPDNPTYKKGSTPPRFNKYELFDRLAFESIILSMGIRQLLNKVELSPADITRVLLAEATINEIVSEANR
ncbi:MAG: hypothetical protein RLZZ419_1634 [Pseudomonadota bacterium]|jgi:hypothetical protein